MWCYLADQNDPVFSSEYLENMQISEDSKQAIRGALMEDPNKRITLPVFMNCLSKIKGYDQPFKEANLSETKKNSTGVNSLSVPIEDIKIKPIHAKVIYHICCLLYKLSTRNVFYGKDDLQVVNNSIASLLEIGSKLLQDNKADPIKSQEYAKETKKYFNAFRNHFPITILMDSTSMPTGPDELIRIIEQTFMQRVREFISTFRDSPFESENVPLILECKRFFVLCYLFNTSYFPFDNHIEDDIIMFKLSKLDSEINLEREFNFYKGKYEMQIESNPSNSNNSSFIRE
jgi:hypothetical protein